MSTRRQCLATAGLSLLAACSSTPAVDRRAAAQPTTPSPNADLEQRFRGASGWVKCIDSMTNFGAYQDYIGIVYTPEGYEFGIVRGLRVPGMIGGGYGSAPPRTLRLVWYSRGSRRFYKTSGDDWGKPGFEGPMVFEVTVPVAERIPDEVIEALRRDREGTLRIKVRAHPETLLVGWDVMTRVNPRGLTPEERQAKKIYLPIEYRHIGGDFKEARMAESVKTDRGVTDISAAVRFKPPLPKEWADQGLFLSPDGRLYEKGWYIDPVTRERIETLY